MNSRKGRKDTTILFANFADFFAIFAVKKLAPSLNLKFQFHSVVRQPHMRRQRRIGRRVRQIVADVGEERPLRFHPLHDAQRILHRRMRGMRLVPQRVQKQDVEVLATCSNDASGTAL